jgi:membrane-associated phospholipid phosphatase
VTALVVGAALAARARGQTAAPETANPEAVDQATPEAAASPTAKGGVSRAIGNELRRYVEDGRTILLAPIYWDGRSWATAGAVVGSIALIATQDEAIDRALSSHHSPPAESVSTAATPFGSYAAVGISVAALGGGLAFKNKELRDTGRDAIEAEIFAAGIITPVLKATIGRTRPSQGSDGDEARPFGGNQSFPSGHATEAFAVASVFAARSHGWVVPTVSYALASAVAFARVYDREHHASDVVAGAVIGTAVGQSVVRRHAGETRASWDLVPFRAGRGVGIGVRLLPAAPRQPSPILDPAPVDALSGAGGD